MAVILITGPQNSGKSAVAEQMVKAMEEPVVYIGTLPYLGEHVDRIRRHKELRPNWPTVDLIGSPGYDHAELAGISGATVLLDGMATYIHRCLFHDPSPEQLRQTPLWILSEVAALSGRNHNVVVVSTEASDLTEPAGGPTSVVLEGIKSMADRWIQVQPRGKERVGNEAPDSLG